MKTLPQTLPDITAESQTDCSRVRAVVVNYNGAVVTLGCVQSLLAQDYLRQVEIVVVDNRSPEDDWRNLQQCLAGYPVVLHRCPKNVGYAGGINAGARLRTDRVPDYILALNSDIKFPRANAIRQLVKALQEDPKRVACSPLIHAPDSPVPPNAASQVWRLPGFWMLLVTHSCWLRRTGFGRRMTSQYLYEDRRPFPLEAQFDCETINGSCFLLDRRFLESIGYLDDRTFLYMEEHILGASIRSRNTTACLCTAVVADHIQGVSTGMRGHRRPLRRELQQVNSELLYLRHYLGTNWLGQSLFLLVRGVDLLLKTAYAPIRARMET